MPSAAQKLLLIQGVAAISAVGPNGPLFAGRTNGAWFTSDDNTYLTVGADGTGGAVAANGTVGRWLDRSGFGNHLSQATANIRPVYRVGSVNFFWGTNTTGRQAWLGTAAAALFDNMAFSGGIICGGAINSTPIVDFGASLFGVVFNAHSSAAGINASSVGFNEFSNSVNYRHSGLPHLASKCVVTWRLNGSNIILHVNGVAYSTSAAELQTTFAKIKMASFDGGAPKPCTISEMVMYDYDIGAGNQTALDAYLRTKAGTYDNTKSVVMLGDSLSMGVGSETYKPWNTYVSNRSTSRWHNMGYDGGAIRADYQELTAANFLVSGFMASAETVCVIWIGTNDIIQAYGTGAQTAAAIKAYSDALRAGGVKVVVCTLQQVPTNDAQRLLLNAQIRADSLCYDAIADLAASASLSTCTNNTYFTTDQTHLMDAGYVVAAGIIETALETIQFGAPALTSPTDANSGQTTATLGVTTSGADGTLYAVVTTSATPPTQAQVKAGQNNSGSAAAFAGSQAISSTGAKTISATGLTATTQYYSYFMHESASALKSVVVAADGFSTAGGALLDGIAPTAVYSFRKMLTAYAGNCVKIRASGDDATLNVGFTAGNVVDAAAIAAHLVAHGGTAFIDTWYDQSGGGLHLVQAITANQPAYIASGINSLPTARFDGSNDILSKASVALSSLFNTNEGTLLMVIKQTGSNANNGAFEWGSSGLNTVGILATYGNTFYWDFGTDSTGRVTVAQPGGWDDAGHVLELFRQTDNTQAIIVDGTSLVSGSKSASPSGTATIDLGVYQTIYFMGDISELVACKTDIGSTVRGTVRKDGVGSGVSGSMGTYYGITVA